MDRNLPLILHSAVFNERVGGLAGDKLPIVLLAGREGGEAAGDVAVSAGLNTTNCQLENYNAFSCDISALFDLSLLSSACASNKTIRRADIHDIKHSTRQIIISLSHLFLFRSWKIFFIVFTRNCC